MHRARFIHRVIAWMVMGGYAIVASGLPLPLGAVAPTAARTPAAARIAAKDRSRPFPCMDKPCGCVSAEQCFSSCCCNSPAELMAWAKAKRVAPDLIAALAGRVSSPAAGCCSTAVPAACRAEAAGPACCVSSPPAEPDQKRQPEPEPTARRTVILRAMLVCGGIVADWLAVGVALPPRVVTGGHAAGPGAAVILADEFSCAERAAPDGPPPRQS